MEDALKKSFKPELLSRLDEVVIVDQIKKDQMIEIVYIMLLKVQERYNKIWKV